MCGPRTSRRQNEITYDKIAGARISYGGRGQTDGCAAAALRPADGRQSSAVLKGPGCANFFRFCWRCSASAAAGRRATSSDRRHRWLRPGPASILPARRLRHTARPNQAPMPQRPPPMAQPHCCPWRGRRSRRAFDRMRRGAEGHDYVKLNNQFIVPVIADGKVSSLVILSLSLEVTAGGAPRSMRSSRNCATLSCRYCSDHANSGGFAGNFTEGEQDAGAAQCAARGGGKLLGSIVSDVLIVDIVRQEPELQSGLSLNLAATVSAPLRGQRQCARYRGSATSLRFAAQAPG